MTVWFDKERRKWRYHFQLRNRRRTGYCIHPDTQVEAKTRRAAEQVEKVIQDRFGRNAPNATAITGFTLAEAAAHYSKTHAKNLASWPAIKPRLANILKWFGPSRDIATITDDDIVDYANALRTQKIKFWTGGPTKGKGSYKTSDRVQSIASINDHLKYLKALLSTKKARRYLPSPPDIKMLKEPKRIPTPIDHDLAETILKHSAPHLKRTIVICIHTGMREREALTARTQQFNQTQRIIYLDETTKARAGRAVYVNEIAFQTIRQAMEDGERLWTAIQGCKETAAEYAKKWAIRTRGDIPLLLYVPEGRNALPRPIASIATAWKAARRRAGIKGGLRFHDTRASFCSYLAHMGVPTVDIQRLAGHEDIETTMRYIKGADTRLMEAVGRLVNVGNFDKKPSEPAHETRTQIKAVGT